MISVGIASLISRISGGTYLASLGQAGYVLKSKSGQLLAVDPYLSECVERLEGNMGFKRLLPKILQPSELIFDVVVATHGHWDHFDFDAMPEIMGNPKTKLYCSVGCKDLVRQGGIDELNVTYICPGDEAIEGDFHIFFVECDHGDSAPDAVGVMVDVDGKRIYETGDTCLRLDRVSKIAGSGKTDVLIAPINGMYGNMNEIECAELSGFLEPGLTIPCHYGMFASHGGNPGKFYEVMKNKYPGNSFFLMAQGEILKL